MRLLTAIAVMALSMSLTVSVAVAEDICWEKADPALKSLKTWSDLHAWHKKFPKCDDGYFAEGLSEFVVASLAKRWETLQLLKTETIANKKFEVFVLKHIDSTTDEDDLAVVIRNAETKCPAKLGAFCERLAKKAQMALKEIGK